MSANAMQTPEIIKLARPNPLSENLLVNQQINFCGWIMQLQDSSMASRCLNNARFVRWVCPYLLAFCCASCVDRKDPSDISLQGPDFCRALKKTIDWDDVIASLNNISIFYRKSCYQDVIEQVDVARKKLSHKTFSVTKEALEFLIPEGKVTDYVLESYERGYLSFLSAASHVKLDREKQVPPELNKFYNEETALTYNHGRDPVNALIQAAMWDNFKAFGFSSRPFWLWLERQNDVDPIIRTFAQKQIARIDSGGSGYSQRLWRVYELGRFPDLEWEMKFIDNEHGYFRVTPKQSFPAACVENEVLLLPTQSWFSKIGRRHARSYHPLVNVKSWIRLPVGLVLGLSTYTSGAAIAIGGCVADAQVRAKGNLCELSIQGAKAVMDLSPGVVKYVLEPDLRHWRELPAAVVVVPADDANWKANGCLLKYGDDRLRLIL